MVDEFKIDWHKAIEDAAIDYADEYCEMQCDSENDHQRAHREALHYLRETIKAALAKAPAWHDAPTCAGLWVNSISCRAEAVIAETLHAWQSTGARWYGPIPADVKEQSA